MPDLADHTSILDDVEAATSKELHACYTRHRKGHNPHDILPFTILHNESCLRLRNRALSMAGLGGRHPLLVSSRKIFSMLGA